MHLTVQPARLDLDPDDVRGEYRARGLDRLSDEQLFAMAAGAVAIPKREPANSFVLHAPLELLARRALLGAVAPDRRVAVREEIVRVAAQYERAAEPIEPARDQSFTSPAEATTVLAAAIASKDLDTVDCAASWLARHGTTDDVMTLADHAIGSLAAAGHASIYFLLLARTAWSNRTALMLLRPLAREVARYPELRVEWLDDAVVETSERSDAGPRLAHALAETPRLGLPGTDFVYPTVHQVDASGQARTIVAANLPNDGAVASRAILRVAARSMLQDDPTYAPYGWTHCLTLPQAALGVRPWLRDPLAATAIAATYVVAFRAAEGARAIDPELRPEPVAQSARDALDAEPAVAAAAVFHASAEELEAITPELAARGGGHHDAHVAKYTLACFDAGSADPAARSLYLAAAAYLQAWWAQVR
jgi:hypothetical protein